MSYAHLIALILSILLYSLLALAFLVISISISRLGKGVHYLHVTKYLLKGKYSYLICDLVRLGICSSSPSSDSFLHSDQRIFS